MDPDSEEWVTQLGRESCNSSEAVGSRFLQVEVLWKGGGRQEVSTRGRTDAARVSADEMTRRGRQWK